VFQEIGIHKRFQIALEKRIKELIESEDIAKFNNIPLNSTIRSPMSFIQNNNFSSINTNEAFGTFFFINKENGNEVYLMALPKVIILLILNQNFERILEFEYKNAELSDRVIIELSARLSIASEEFNSSKTKFIIDERRKRYFYQVYQNISYTSSGRIFGTIKS
jgi:hypothetical protein